MSNIIQLIKEKFPDDIMESAAKTLNESTINLKKSIDTGISLLMVSILFKVEQKGWKNILRITQRKLTINDDFIQKSKNPFEIELSNPKAGVVGEYGFFLHLLFQEKSNKIIDNYAGFSGIKSISAHHVLSAIIPVILSLINKNSTLEQEHILTAYILNQKENILKSLPLDKNFNPAYFFPNTSSLQNQADHNISQNENHRIHGHKTQYKGIWTFLLLLLIALNLFWWFLKRYR